MKGPKICWAAFQWYCWVNNTPAIRVQDTVVVPICPPHRIFRAPSFAILCVKHGACARQWDSHWPEETLNEREQLIWLHDDFGGAFGGAAGFPFLDFQRGFWTHHLDADVNEVRPNRLCRRIAFIFSNPSCRHDLRTVEARLPGLVAPLSP